MTLTQAVVSYAMVFIVLLMALGNALWRYKISWSKLPSLPAIKFKLARALGK